MVDLSEIRDRDVDLVDPVRVSQEDPTHGKEPGKKLIRKISTKVS